MNFLQSIKAQNPSPEAHRNLLRFGRGTFDREQITVRKTKTQVDASAGFEYYLTFYRIFLEHIETDEVSVKGTVIGPKQQIQQLLEELNIQPSKLFGKKFTLDYVADKRELATLADRIERTSGHLLLTLKAGSYSLTSKTTFPKPGKLVEKFCRLKIPVEYEREVREALLLPEFVKKAEISTVYNVKAINFDEGLLESDPSRARLESTRELEVTRRVSLDGAEPIEERFSAVV